MKVFQVILDETADTDLIAFLDSYPRGRKNDAIRSALRAGLQQQDNTNLLHEILHEIRRLQRDGVTTREPATQIDDEVISNLDRLLGL